MQKIMLTLFVTSLLVGCSTLGVYKVDIPQGTPLTQAQAAKIQVGMSHQQVRFLLGSPTVSDPLNPQGQHLKIYFNQSGIVERVEGLETIPESQPGLPGSKEAILNAPPL